MIDDLTDGGIRRDLIIDELGKRLKDHQKAD